MVIEVNDVIDGNDDNGLGLEPTLRRAPQRLEVKKGDWR